MIPSRQIDFPSKLASEVISCLIIGIGCLRDRSVFLRDDVDSASGVNEDFREDNPFDFQCDHQGIVVGLVELYSFVLVESHDFFFSYRIFAGDDGEIVGHF